MGLVVHRAQLVEQIREHAAEQGRRLAADEIIRILAHDLHNLLTSLKGNVDLLTPRGATMSPERVVQHAAAAGAAAERRRRLVDGLLDADRLERGVFTLGPQIVDMAALARETVRAYGAEGSRIRVNTPGEVSIAADLDRLRQAIENLLGNSLKHSPPGEPVEVGVTAEAEGGGSWATITVADRGPGIPAELLPRLFTRFAAGPGSSGLGLGLYIARRIAAAYGDDLTVESAPGAGSRFRLRLPAAA